MYYPDHFLMLPGSVAPALRPLYRPGVINVVLLFPLGDQSSIRSGPRSWPGLFPDPRPAAPLHGTVPAIGTVAPKHGAPCRKGRGHSGELWPKIRQDCGTADTGFAVLPVSEGGTGHRAGTAVVPYVDQLATEAD
jgi:hypothetical protein